MKYDPDATRGNLIQAAFDEVYRKGMRSASLDGILERAGVTKGALYHHFPNKKALCVAMVDEVIRPRVLELWVEPLAHSDDPIGTLQEILRTRALPTSEEQVRCGCPLNNLSQEMSSVDEEFRLQLVNVYDHWRTGIREALERGQKAGTVRRDIDSGDTALFIVSSMEGAMGMAKNVHSVDALRSATGVLVSFLETLRPNN